MNDTKLTFYDNTHVKRTKDYNEYFGLSLAPIEREGVRHEVSIYRYRVPGRCDTYYFTWEKDHPNKVSYFSDGWQSIVESAKMVKRDLDKPQVVKLFVDAFTDEKICLRHRRDVMDLLRVIGPNSKTINALEKQIKKTLFNRVDRLVAEGVITKERAKRVIQFI